MQRLFALNGPRRGVTVSVGTIDGGLGPNVVAPKARALIEMRVHRTRPPRRRSKLRFAGWSPSWPARRSRSRATQPAADGGLGRSRALYRKARRLAAELDLVGEADLVGGASDANTTSRFTATLDELGAVGARPMRRTSTSRSRQRSPAGPRCWRCSSWSLPRSRSARAGVRRTGPQAALLGSDTRFTNGALVRTWQGLEIDAELVPPLRHGP